MHLTDDDELRLLHIATRAGWWRWQTEEKKLRKQGKADPFTINLGSIQVMHMVWRELRRQSGCSSQEPPMRVRRIARRLADHKCRAYLRENPG